MSIGERILELRKEQKMSQTQLADAMEVSRQAISKWENDQATPDAIRMIKLAEVLDTDIEYLSTGRRNMGRRPPVVIKTTETVEKIVERPVIQTVEKIVEVPKPVDRVVERPVVVEKPVIHKVVRVKYRQNPLLCIGIGIACFLFGLLLGFFLWHSPALPIT